MAYNVVQQRHLSVVTKTDVMSKHQELQLVLKICKQPTKEKIRCKLSKDSRKHGKWIRCALIYMAMCQK